MNGFLLKEFLIGGSKHVSVLTATIDNPIWQLFMALAVLFSIYVVVTNEFDSEIHECFIGIMSIVGNADCLTVFCLFVNTSCRRNN